MSEVALVDPREIAANMLQQGYQPAEIATILRMDLEAVRTVQTTTLAPADKEIAEAMRNLVWMAYEEAVYLIRYGSPTDRIGLIKLILAGGMRLVGAETSTKFDEMRATFDDMMKGIRSPTDMMPDIPTDDDDAEARALIGDAYNPD